MSRKVRTLEELKRVLIEEERIDPREFYFDEEPGCRQNLRRCIIRENGKWKVFYTERGEEHDVQFFDTEEEAVQYFYDWAMDDKEYIGEATDEEIEKWKRFQEWWEVAKNRKVRTVGELKRVLIEEERLHPKDFHFQGEPDYGKIESWHIVFEDGKWRVYFYGQDGLKYHYREYDREEDACQYLYRWAIEFAELADKISDEEFAEWKKREGR